MNSARGSETEDEAAPPFEMRADFRSGPVEGPARTLDSRHLGDLDIVDADVVRAEYGSVSSGLPIQLQI